MRYSHILSRMTTMVWAMLPEKMDQIIGVLNSRALMLDMPAAALPVPAAPRSSGGVATDIGVIQIYGIIEQHMDVMGPASGGATTDGIAQMLDAAMDDPGIKSILFDIDSPGGSVYGVQELADRIYSMRGRKPMTAVANSLMTSAAYWIGSAADHIAITPGGVLGSIGVYAMHMDYSKANEQEGVKPTYIFAGKHKVEGNFDEPLADEARGRMQAMVDETYDRFVSGVARNRNINAADVLRDYGEGRWFTAAEAKRRGMADSIHTFDDTVRMMAQNKQGRMTKGRAAAMIEIAKRR